MSAMNNVISGCQTSEGDSFVFCLSIINRYPVVVALR